MKLMHCQIRVKDQEKSKQNESFRTLVFVPMNMLKLFFLSCPEVLKHFGKNTRDCTLNVSFRHTAFAYNHGSQMMLQNHTGTCIMNLPGGITSKDIDLKPPLLFQLPEGIHCHVWCQLAQVDRRYPWNNLCSHSPGWPRASTGPPGAESIW